MLHFSSLPSYTAPKPLGLLEDEVEPMSNPAFDLSDSPHHLLPIVEFIADHVGTGLAERFTLEPNDDFEGPKAFSDNRNPNLQVRYIQPWIKPAYRTCF